MKSGEPGSACLLIVLNTTIEMAVVGPETRCHDDPKRAAKTGVTIAVYRPYWGGRPAIIEKATPWGNTITAPVSAAKISDLIVLELIFGAHKRKGNKGRVNFFT